MTAADSTPEPTWGSEKLEAGQKGEGKGIASWVVISERNMWCLDAASDHASLDLGAERQNSRLSGVAPLALEDADDLRKALVRARRLDTLKTAPMFVAHCRSTSRCGEAQCCFLFLGLLPLNAHVSFLLYVPTYRSIRPCVSVTLRQYPSRDRVTTAAYQRPNMVSFSCDHFQNVFTKPKIERHLQACRTATVSCIDCGTVFSRQTIRSHKSCITESEKYGPRSTNSDATFCVNCQLKLNGAVHAKQHYDSKKHRVRLRREKQFAAKQQAHDGRRTEQSDRNDERNGKTLHASNELPSIRGLKKVIKKVLKKAPNETLHIKTLVAQVAERLGLHSSSKLSHMVKRKVDASSRFGLSNEDVTLSRRSKEMKGEWYIGCPFCTQKVYAEVSAVTKVV